MPVRQVLAALVVAIAGASVPSQADPVRVEVVRDGDGWALERGGEPYFIHGVGGNASLERLAAAGGNSVRTWGADDLDAMLDEAHGLGLTVTVGIWLGHERHGFDYANKDQVREQLERARQTVLRYKDHPALLLWGVGNEMEGFGEGDDPAIWKAVNDIAAMIKDLDPHHPTMTITADIGGGRIDAVQRLCPAIDIHGINSYGGAASLPQRYRRGGGQKPYVLTEFGPAGAWEVGKTDWGAPLEPSSTRKAELYAEHYEKAIEKAPGLALGSYAFLWGHKMEATATWFGLFLPDGTPLEAVDTLSGLWGAPAAAERAPRIAALKIDGKTTRDPGERVRATLTASDPNGGDVRVEWALRRESHDYLTGGDVRPRIPDIDGAIVEGDAGGALVQLPDDPAAYRLFAYVYNDAGKAATANVPLKIRGEPRAAFPIYVYVDGLAGMPWAPSGWMGASDALTLDGAHTANPYRGEANLRLHFTAKAGWVGVAWQHPPNNWGEQDGGFDLTGARYLELWARGDYGGEKVSFGVGLLGDDVPHPDSAIARKEGVVLTDAWQRYRIPLKRKDLSSIKTGFVITLSARSSPVTVHLDHIRFVR